MLRTVVVFVHGFTSGPQCWDSFFDCLSKDADFAGKSYELRRFRYPTEILELDLTKRIPGIEECGEYLRAFIGKLPDYDRLFLVGHSMGGLVIEGYLAREIRDRHGTALAKIRSVILFATPNRGSTMLKSLRDIFSFFFKNPQMKGLEVLDDEVAEMNEVITRFILGANCVDHGCCPIPFQVFWGLEDNIVTKASASGSFVEASPLPGGHSEIIQCDPVKDKDNARYEALKSALLNPVGHPSIYEIDLFEVTLAVSPTDPAAVFTLGGDVKPLTIATENVAIRTLRISFSKQNRCAAQYEQKYWSKDGLVELLSLTEPNRAARNEQSEYHDEGRKFTYAFVPEEGKAFQIRLRIFNGFGPGQRTWHNHMNPNARYKLFRFNLDLEDYKRAGYRLSHLPTMFYFPQDTFDHALCATRVGETPLPPLPSADPWKQTWELSDIHGGVVDLVWDVEYSSTD